MFGETTISQVKVWNHQTETTILKWMFRVPGTCSSPLPLKGIYKRRSNGARSAQSRAPAAKTRLAAEPNRKKTRHR